MVQVPPCAKVASPSWHGGSAALATPEVSLQPRALGFGMVWSFKRGGNIREARTRLGIPKSIQTYTNGGSLGGKPQVRPSQPGSPKSNPPNTPTNIELEGTRRNPTSSNKEHLAGSMFAGRVVPAELSVEQPGALRHAMLPTRVALVNGNQD